MDIRYGLRVTKRSKTIPADISSWPPGEVLKCQSPWRPAWPPQSGAVGMALLTGGAPTADIIEYPDGSMAFNPTVGWGKDGLAYSIRSALDREYARRAAGGDTTADADDKAA